MLAYHNKPKLKLDILEQLCTTDYKIPMDEYETWFGIPEVLARIQRAIFEGLPTKVAIDWPIRFMSAIPVGADLSGIWRDFATWMLIDPVDGVIQHTNPGTDAHEVIIRVANLYRDGHTTQQMRDACDAAYVVKNAASATASATRSAAAAVIYFSVASAYLIAAARAASYTVAVAVDAAVDAHSIFDDDANAARDAIYTKMSNKLIELLQNSDKTRIENASLS